MSKLSAQNTDFGLEIICLKGGGRDWEGNNNRTTVIVVVVGSKLIS